MTARITLALLFVIPAAMAYPWRSVTERWILGVAVVAVILLFAWWRGLFVTGIVGRRIAMWRRNHAKGTHSKRGDTLSEFETVALRFDDSARQVAFALIAGYLDRYGLRLDRFKVTSRDAGGQRTTWVALTLGAADNLAALQARSPRIPLRDTVEVATRRLADHLRENGSDVSFVDGSHGPSLPSGSETWRGVRSDTEYLSAYRIRITDALAETLGAVWAHPASEAWTAVEISGSAAHPAITAACAYRTSEQPGAGVPVAGLTPLRGEHGPALDALDPQSAVRLPGAAVAVPADLVARLRWPISQTQMSEPSVLTEPTELSRT